MRLLPSEQSSGSNILIAYFTAAENSGVDAVALGQLQHRQR